MGLLDLFTENLKVNFNNLNRSFYETVSPAVDVYWIDGDELEIKMDLPGFDIKEIKVSLENNIIHVEAERDSISEILDREKRKNGKVFFEHRPIKINSNIPLPYRQIDDDDKIPKILEQHLTMKNGVLTIHIVDVPKGNQGNTCVPNWDHQEKSKSSSKMP